MASVQETIEENRILEHMPYNHSLLFQLNSAIQNISIGGSGFEQIQCLRACLKPMYRDELNKVLEKGDIEYNLKAEKLIKKFNKAYLGSHRTFYLTKIKLLRRLYTKQVINELIALFDKYNVLEEKEREGLKSGLI